MSLKTGIGHHPITIGNQKMFGLSVYDMVQSSTISFWLKNSFLKEKCQIGFTKVPITQYTPNISLKTSMGHHPITIGNQKMYRLSHYEVVQSGTTNF